MQLSPARELLGMERYAIDCCGANLYVHDHAVVIDKTGGLWIVGDNNFKVIPFKSIAAIQVKLQSTIINGYLEFKPANSPFTIGSGKAEQTRENSVILSGTDERYAEAKEALPYIFDKICNH